MDGPVRIGGTIRRAFGANTKFAQSVLRHLTDAGVTWAPRALGIDEQGREAVSWIPGQTATSGEQIDLHELARVVRRLHDLTATLVDRLECVIHDDLQPRNVVVRHRWPVGLIDWEQARPGRRVEDVANLCWSFIEPVPGRNPFEIGQQWRLLAEIYGLEGLDALLPTVLARMAACVEDIERGAARGSARHHFFERSGDHVAIRAMHTWVVDNERLLRDAIIA